jgi:hypothetical protein
MIEREGSRGRLALKHLKSDAHPVEKEAEIGV